MKTLGEAAMDLPWLAPSVASLTALARSPLSTVWSELRTDPGSCCFRPIRPMLPSRPLDVGLPRSHPGLPAPRFARLRRLESIRGRTCVCRYAIARPACATAGGRAGCDADRPGSPGFLAPLGWLALDGRRPPGIITECSRTKASRQQRPWPGNTAWGHDHTAARRLAALALAGLVDRPLGHLGLHVSIAKPGADADALSACATRRRAGPAARARPWA